LTNACINPAASPGRTGSHNCGAGAGLASILPGAYCVSSTGWLDEASTTPPADWYCVWMKYPGWSALGTVSAQGDVAQVVEVLLPFGAVTTATTFAALATPAREKSMYTCRGVVDATPPNRTAGHAE
jgi:hypothetical protein